MDTQADRVREKAMPLLSEGEMEMARIAQRRLVQALDRSSAAALIVTTDAGVQPTIAVPPAALKLIGQVLGALAEGREPAFVPVQQEFTPAEAATFLNVSRPFVIKEIEAGRLPHREVDAQPRVAFDDLQNYARTMRDGQSEALDRMAENARELGLDY